MPTASGKPLNLVEIVNKHSKNAMAKKSRNNLAAKLAGLKIARPSDAVYTMRTWSSSPPAQKKNCGPKPTQWVAGKKNPNFTAWSACNTASAAGGKRYTRRAKKAKRMTRRK